MQLCYYVGGGAWGYRNYSLHELMLHKLMKAVNIQRNSWKTSDARLFDRVFDRVY